MSSPASLARFDGIGIKFGFSRPFWSVVPRFCPLRCWCGLDTCCHPPMEGRALTVYFAGNLSSNGMLFGRTVRVQSCSVGKYGMAFSGFLPSTIWHLLLNSGQFLLQLACVFSLHAAQ